MNKICSFNSSTKNVKKKSYLALSLNYVTILDIHDTYMYTKEKKSIVCRIMVAQTIILDL